MTKLQRAVDSQTIQFLALPRIFNSLSGDLPSGAVKLPNGETAYWRLHRNLTELKKNRKNVKDIAVRLAQAFKALVNSDAFLNHYGLAKAPDIQTETQLATQFRNLLGLNTNRVDYSTIHHGRQKPLLETLIVPLGNLTFFNAYRGVQDVPKVPGIKGKLWLNESSDADQCFNFTIVSPVVNLADFISSERLMQEVLTKIKQNMPLIAHTPKVVFAEGQFDNYVGRGLQELTEKHGGQQNGANKKQKQQKKAEGGKNEFNVLTKDEFNALDDEGKATYISTIATWSKSAATPLVAKFLESGILAEEVASYNSTAEMQVTLPYYLSKLVDLTDEQFAIVLPGVDMFITPAITAGDVGTQMAEDEAVGASSIG